MKRILSIILCAILLVGCTVSVSSCKTADDGKYEIAFVTDVGQLMDKSFNQGTWEGVESYAKANSKTYKYYQPANGTDATDDDRYNSMKAAVDNGAKIVVCAGFMQATALAKIAAENKDVKFVFIDGWALEDADKNVLANVCAIDFQEEQSGYLAGYAAVMEGYTKLGFAGGGGGTNPACCRFGYGFVQGADAAAKIQNVDVAVNYSWAYGSTFAASDDLQTMLTGWYENGTEVIFCCGGSMCKSAFAAASAKGKKVIGVDVDQSAESDTVITSATKGLQSAVKFALAKFYDEKWTDVGGKLTTLGAAQDAIGLPTETWSLTKFTKDNYTELLGKLKDGSVTISKEYEGLETQKFDKTTVTVVK